MLGQTVIEPARVALTDPRNWGHRTLHRAAAFKTTAIRCAGNDQSPTPHGAGRNEAFRDWNPDDWNSLGEWLRGVELFNDGLFWEAHEEWERLWRAKQKGSTEEVFIQGMIQIAAALVQISRSAPDGALSLSTKSLVKIEEVAEKFNHFMGLDPARIVAEFRHYFEPLKKRVLPPLDASVPNLDLSGVAAG